MKNLCFYLIFFMLNFNLYAQEFIEDLSFENYSYSSSLIEYDNKLYGRYYNASNNKSHLGYINNNNELTIIPNPSSTRDYRGYPIKYNGNLYLQFYDHNSDVYLLYEYDGIDLTLVPNPPNHNNTYSGYRIVQNSENMAFIFNSKLYLRYMDNNDVYRLYEFDGNSLSVIPNPSNHNTQAKGYFGDPIEYNNNYYLKYRNNSFTTRLYKFDGNNLTLVSNGTNRYDGYPIVYNNKLYLKYANNSNENILYEYDGTNMLSIANPPNFNDNSAGYWGEPFIFNDNLLLKYRNNSGNFQLVICNGSDLSIVANPTDFNGSNAGYLPLKPFTLNNKAYFRIRNNSFSWKMGEFDGTSLTPIEDPDGFSYYDEKPFFYNNNVYLKYRNPTYSLFKFDGSSFTLIKPINPNLGNYLTTKPFEFNNEYYLKYYNNNTSSLVLARLRQTNAWQGSIDSDWQNINNWSKAEIPNEKDLIVITDETNQPDISNNLSVELRDLTIEPSAFLNNYGTIKIDSKLTNNGQITFKSNANGTGQLDEFTGTYSGAGTVQVERYVPAKRSFRFVTSAVDSEESIFNNWQENGNAPTGFGTHITGSETGENGFDATETGNVSFFDFDNSSQTWAAVSNTDVDDLIAGKAYRLYIRGDRNIDLTNNEAENETILRANGDLKIGDVLADNLGENADDFSFIGNPYQATVDMSGLTFNNVNSSFYWVWDPNINDDGAYVVVDLNNGSNPGTSDANQFLQPGQAAFVRTSADGAASVTFTEASKNTDEVSNAIFSNNNEPKLNLRLYESSALQNGKMEFDALEIRFNSEGNNEVNSQDAPKLSNPSENLARLNGDDFLAIENRELPQDEEELSLATYNFEHTNYIFEANLSYFPENVTVYLNDNYTNSQTILENGSNYIDFNVDVSIPESVDMSRFTLSFKNTTLGVSDENSENFKLYPNPTKKTVYVSNLSENTSAIVYDVLGKEVKRVNNVNLSSGIDIGNLANGIYFIRLSTESQSITKRIVKY